MVSRTAQTSLRQAAREAPNGNVAVALAVFTSVALFAILFPWFPGSQQLAVGTRVDRDILSPRDLTYESEVLSAETREAAAAAVEEVLVFDPEIREQQAGELDRIIAAIAKERSDATKSASARETAVQAIAGTELSPAAAGVLISVDADTWATMQEEARDALSRTLTGAVSANELEDARARASNLISPGLEPAQRSALSEMLGPLVVPTLAVSVERTETLRAEARANTPAVRVTYAAGDVVAPAGTEIDAAGLEAIEQLDIRTGSITVTAILAAAIVSLLGGAGFGAHLWVAKPRSLRGVRRLALFVLTALVPLVVAKFVFPIILPDHDDLYLALALPLAAGPIVAAVLLDLASGVVATLIVSSVVGYLAMAVPSTSGSLAGESDALLLVLATGSGSLGGLLVASRAERLQGYLGAGLAAASAGALWAVVVLLLDSDRSVEALAWIAGASALGGLLTATISVGAFVLLSRPFGIITRVELMELVQLNHPLLRRLQDEAPGTFQHSMLVGSLADRAADRIGADSLLVRVGAYYHDIGKLHSPGFFVENFGDGPNPHENLDPLQSSRVIMRHVSAGVELARKHGLPEAVVAFVQQHHGTRLVAFFYRQAAQVKPDIEPELFEYPGPKPQSRETALVMLADASEASVRASSERTADRIRQIVDATIRERLDEGQFDECDISMRDLRIAADSFVQSLSAVYHPRVEYPEPSRRELAARRSFEPVDEDDGTPTTRSGGGRPRTERPRPSEATRPSVIVTDDEAESMLSEDDN